MTSQLKTRTGGQVVIETLQALGAQLVFGLPGIHTLPLWEALRTRAWQQALTPPSGPTYVEVPVDLLRDEAEMSPPISLNPEPPPPAAASQTLVVEAARLLARAQRPVIWAGGGVLRSEAWRELAELAGRLDAPVATTYMGKGAFPEDHPLSAG